MKFLCLINLSSGSRDKEFLRRLNALEHFDITVAEIDFVKLKEQVAGAGRYDCVLIGGGDGTASTVLPELSGLDLKVGLLPLGTANDLAKELGVMRFFNRNKPETLLNFYLSAKTREFQTWQLCFGRGFKASRYFCNYLSFGFDALIIREFESWRRNSGSRLLKLGRTGNRIGYLKAVARNMTFINKDLFSVRVGESKKDKFLLKPRSSVIFANIKSFMGLGQSNCQGSPFDSCLELITTNSLLDYGNMFFSNRLPLFKPKYMGTAECWQIEGVRPSTLLQVDGEYISGDFSPVCRIQPAGRVNVLVADSRGR
ncbi:MAG: hypothetical protein D6719_03540 [Candidatus Dadabacteria bacterium]|nr:MAG: hypothetical protein D6719_03540 [Candidatus Dadabacteria bacterium]